MLRERVKIPVAVQKVIPAFDAPGGDHGIDGLADRHSEGAQRPEILRRLNCDFLPAQLHDYQRRQHSPGFVEVAFLGEALSRLSGTLISAPCCGAVTTVSMD